MKKIIILYWLFCVVAFKVAAQGEQNIWAFGNVSIDFNTSSPLNYANNLSPAYEGTASICNASGQMLFYTNGFWVWNRYNEIMPELTGGVSGYTSATSPSIGYPPLMPWNGSQATQATTIAGMPSHPNKYYVFSLSTSGQLFYSVIDMTMNAGKGGIAPGKKSIFINAGLTEKLTVVKGCNNIWLMTRAKTSNQYRAFEINDTGIVTTPVISTVGNFPLGWYRYGVIKFSPDGTKMAAACNEAWNTKGGIELYDFNQQTGKLSNSLILDSSSNLGYYYGACFSPDNTKLYATTSSFSYLNTFHAGKVHQFDLSLTTSAAIIASHTIVLNNTVYDLDNMGDLKRANNGKIYLGNGLSAMHSIDNPNAAGLSCMPVVNALLFSSGNTYRGMPNDIAIITPPDSLYAIKNITVCFKDTAMLTADTGKYYKWDNGSTSRQRAITHDGTYVVRYINGSCKFQTDSIHVRFLKLPKCSASGYSCPAKGNGKIWVTPQSGDTTTFNYTWRNESGTILRQHWSNTGDTLIAADTGKHFVRITTITGCDTTLAIDVIALPVPTASFTADSIACKGAPIGFTNTSTAPIWNWYFGDGNFSTQQHPSYTYNHTGNYTVSLVATNIEGCSDTVAKELKVKGLELKLVADKDLVNKGELVQLRSSGSESYTVVAWEPGFMFADQTATAQTLAVDTTRTFIATGQSAYGCRAKASVEVAVNPIVFMPTAFTPNGDGVNDRFRPVSTGYIFVRYFEIYNRYGQNVYKAYGKSALEGWDGTFNGQLQELGVYYYHINIETKEGGTIALKGDVTLLR